MRTKITVTFSDGSGWTFTKASPDASYYDSEAEWVNVDFSSCGELSAPYRLIQKHVQRFMASVTVESFTPATITVERI